MLRWRLLLGTVFIAALVGLVWADARFSPPGIVLLPLAILLAFLAADEVVLLEPDPDLRPSRALVGGGAAWVASAGAFPAWFPWAQKIGAGTCISLALAVAAMLVFLAEMRTYQRPGRSTARIGLGMLALVYAGLMMSFIVRLRFVGDSRDGLIALVSLVAVVKLGDIGAYTVGRLMGRTKLAPVLSPGKTIEGLAGGLAFSMLGAWLVLAIAWPAFLGDSRPRVSLLACAIYGVLVGGAGVVGDLAESLLKRDQERKDSSTWMPGFGGVLDVIDSLLVAAPIAFAWWSLEWF